MDLPGMDCSPCELGAREVNVYIKAGVKLRTMSGNGNVTQQEQYDFQYIEHGGDCSKWLAGAAGLVPEQLLSGGACAESYDENVIRADATLVGDGSLRTAA